MKHWIRSSSRVSLFHFYQNFTFFYFISIAYLFLIWQISSRLAEVRCPNRTCDSITIFNFEFVELNWRLIESTFIWHGYYCSAEKLEIVKVIDVLALNVERCGVVAGGNTNRWPGLASSFLHRWAKAIYLISFSHKSTNKCYWLSISCNIRVASKEPISYLKIKNFNSISQPIRLGRNSELVSIWYRSKTKQRKSRLNELIRIIGTFNCNRINFNQTLNERKKPFAIVIRN